MKSFAPLSDDPAQHRLALAYACDYTILEPILRSHGYAWADAGLLTASLDHAMWFHRDGRLDDWVLYVQDAQSAGDGRGLARGLFFSRAGEHLATVMQEGMIRAAGAG
jgi:acyl-CoA thioesterase-2